MPINERGEYIRERSQPTSASSPTSSGGSPSNSGGSSSNWNGGCGCVVLLILLGLGGWVVDNWKSQSSKPNPSPPTSVERTPSIPYVPPPAPTPAVGHEVHFSNTCSQPVKVYLSYTQTSGVTGTGEYSFAPNESAFLADGGQRINATGDIFYFAKMVDPERDYTWGGEDEKTVNFTSYKMRRVPAPSSGQIDTEINCKNFWRVKVKNSCSEEISLALHFDPLTPGIGFITDAWWQIAPNAETFLTPTGGGSVEIASATASSPGEVFFFARSKSHTWGKRDTDQGKMVLVKGEFLEMRREELKIGYEGPHLNLTCN